MSLFFKVPDPGWVSQATGPTDILRRRGAMLIRICASYHNPGGSVQALSEAIGLAPRGLHVYRAGGRIVTPDIAIRIENLLGRTVIRREDFRPDHFLSSTK